MPPVERFICRFAAEPPQEALPHGDWAQTLQAEFLAACLRIDARGPGHRRGAASCAGFPTAPGTGAHTCR